MTDLIVVPQAGQWQRLKRLVLDSVSSPITKRVYNLGLDEFFASYELEPRPTTPVTPRTPARCRVRARRSPSTTPPSLSPSPPPRPATAPPERTKTRYT